MANIESALRTYIMADSTITSLVGTKVYLVNVPQNTALPYIRMLLVSDPDDRKYVGGDASQPVFQFDLIATTYAGVKAIDDALRARLKEYKGTGLTGFTVDRIKPISRKDVDEDYTYFRVMTEYRVEYRR